MHEKNRTKSRNALYASFVKGSDLVVNTVEKLLTAELMKEWSVLREEKQEILYEQGWSIYRRNELDIQLQKARALHQQGRLEEAQQAWRKHKVAEEEYRAFKEALMQKREALVDQIEALREKVQRLSLIHI